MFVAKSEKPNKYYKSNLKSSRSKKKKDWILPFFIVLFVIPITNKNWRKIKSPFVLDGVGLKLETSPWPVFCYFTYFGHSESNSWSKHYVLAPVLKGPPNSPSLSNQKVRIPRGAILLYTAHYSRGLWFNLWNLHVHYGQSHRVSTFISFHPLHRDWRTADVYFFGMPWSLNYS